MSASVRHPDHVDLLVTHALRPLARYGTYVYRTTDGPGWDEVPIVEPQAKYLTASIEVTYETADAVGRSLLAENIRSVRYRYPDDDMDSLPGPAGLPALVDSYRFRPTGRDLPAVAVLKALDGYSYQSCEHPGWETSFAFAFCQRLRSDVIGRLPGYDDAATWSYTRPQEAEPVSLLDLMRRN